MVDSSVDLRLRERASDPCSWRSLQSMVPAELCLHVASLAACLDIGNPVTLKCFICIWLTFVYLDEHASQAQARHKSDTPG